MVLEPDRPCAEHIVGRYTGPSPIAIAGSQTSSRPPAPRPKNSNTQQRAARGNSYAAAGQPEFQTFQLHGRTPVPRSTKGDHMASRPEIKVKKSEPDDAAQEAPNQKMKKERSEEHTS